MCGIDTHGNAHAQTHTGRVWCDVDPNGSENGKRRCLVRGEGMWQQKSSAAVEAMAHIAPPHPIPQSPMADPSSGMVMHLTSPHRLTQMSTKGEETPRCQWQKRSLPRCSLQTTSRNSAAEDPARQKCPTQETKRDTRLSKAKTCREVVGGRSARQGSSHSPSGKELAPGRRKGGKGSWDMAPPGSTGYIAP